MNAAPDPMRGMDAALVPSWAERNRAWLIAAIDAMRVRIAGGAPVAVAADGFTPALDHCAKVFGLTGFERDLLLLTVGIELDNGMRTTVAASDQGSARASFALALAKLAGPHWDALSPSGPLRFWHLITPEAGQDLVLARLLVDERVLHFVAGIPASDPVLESVTFATIAGAAALPEDRPLIERITRLVKGADPVGPVIVLQGGDLPLRRDLALAVAAQHPVLWIEAAALPTDPAALLRIARHLDREAALTGALPIVAMAPDHAEPAAMDLVARMRSASLWLGPHDPRLSALPAERRVLTFQLPKPDAERTRTALLSRWRVVDPQGTHPEAVAALGRAAQQFHLEPAMLDAIIDAAQTSAPTGHADVVWQAARVAARGGLERVAERVDSRTCFADLVLPVGQTALLRDIARHVRQRDKVYRDWGFGAGSSLGQGLVALFAGESGTGKTLAAEAIANEVGLDLFRVDLAVVVSKYIGETEKNLKRLFDAAETSGAVLLFDEADALFGKRSDVKDSHDRYANIEIAYLLQRVESYRGLAVLTTNMKGALDQAFMRRIRFVVNFPFPDAAAREQIWRRQFPSAAPVGDVDFVALSRLNLPGGNIRSVALNAAFKAADAGAPIGQTHLMAAAHEEFAKLGRSISATLGGT